MEMGIHMNSYSAQQIGR